MFIQPQFNSTRRKKNIKKSKKTNIKEKTFFLAPKNSRDILTH